MENKIFDCVIIGAGPGGLTAGIYAGRAGLDAVIVDEKGIGGGQIAQTHQVDNYPGLPEVDGFELGQLFQNHAKQWNVNVKSGKVISLEDKGSTKLVVTTGGTLETRTVIIATGAVPRPLGLDGEERLRGSGVSYCATCDGAFYRNKVTAVIGGGDVALEDAFYLSNLCRKVYLIHRRDGFRASETTVRAVREAENIEILTGYVVESIEGENALEGIVIKNVADLGLTDLKIDGLFIAVGNIPVTGFTGDLIKKDEVGYILAGEDCKTNVEGIFAAGDTRKKPLKQVVTAVADGANAVYSLTEFLR